jgi:DNA anti-recombination protein RmuC
MNMNERNLEDLIGSLYDMVQDARALPLGADKCILERDRVLDLLDEILAQMPVELKQSRTIVESRNELINQARREAEGIVRQAQEQAKQMVTREQVYIEAKRRAEEMVNQTQNRINELRKVGNDYMDAALRRTEEAIAQSLNDVRETRVKFRSLTEGQEVRKPQPPQDLEV